MVLVDDSILWPDGYLDGLKIWVHSIAIHYVTWTSKKDNFIVGDSSTIQDISWVITVGPEWLYSICIFLLSWEGYGYWKLEYESNRSILLIRNQKLSLTINQFWIKYDQMI